MGIGVLAPRGWECFGTYGSSGETLYVTPEPMDSKKVLSALRSKFTGAAIQVSRRFGDTSGRFSVAEMIARVFPAYKQFVTDVMGELDRPPRHVAVRAVPVRQAQVQGERAVEYQTPPRSEGLGTHSWLEQNDSPTYGAAMLVGPTPDLLFLTVRLRSNQQHLAASIIGHFERDVSLLPVN